MNREALKKRLDELQELRQQQKDRLATAQNDQREATINLERIEGAAQDCAFWLNKLAEAEKQSAAEHAETNGAAAAAVVEQT